MVALVEFGFKGLKASLSAQKTFVICPTREFISASRFFEDQLMTPEAAISAPFAESAELSCLTEWFPPKNALLN